MKMESINLNLGIEVKIDGEVDGTYSVINDAFEAINIPNTEEYASARISVFQKLLVFGTIDLSNAYPGHSVILTLRNLEGSEK